LPICAACEIFGLSVFCLPGIVLKAGAAGASSPGNEN
jgi:hypothetical protein